MTRSERIEALARKAASQLTKADKDYITKASKDMGVAFTPRPHCPNCYSDQAVLLWAAIKNNVAKELPMEYVLLDGIDVTFGSIRVNKDTLTNELAEKIIAKGFPKYLFAKCK